MAELKGAPATNSERRDKVVSGWAWRRVVGSSSAKWTTRRKGTKRARARAVNEGIEDEEDGKADEKVRARLLSWYGDVV